MSDKDLEKYFGEIVRSTRNKRNISQEDLAGRVGISVTYLCGIERGECLISWDIWLKLCKILDLDVKNFMEKV